MTELTEVKVLPNTESCEEKKLEIFQYEDEQVYLLDKRFQRLHRDAVKLLSKSQLYDKINRIIKGIVIVFSLSSSYLSAISGVDEYIKSYLITSFSLLCALVSGISSIKNYSSESTRLYMGYTHYLLKCSEVEQVFYHFQGTMPYDELILSIDKLFTEYERDIEKTIIQQEANAEKRLVYTIEVMEGYLKTKNNGELPKWYIDKAKLENYKDRYDLNNKQPQIQSKTILEKIKLYFKK
jgi:hypothetical protein